MTRFGVLKNNGRVAITYLALVVILMAVPMVGSERLVLVGVSLFLYAYLNLSWNIVAGYAGQLSMAHVAFMGIGGYTSTILYLQYHLTPWIGMLVGGLVAAVAAIFLSVITFRYGLKGFYFALVTLAFAEVCRLTISGIKFLGGSMGLQIPLRNAPLEFQFFSRTPYYYIAFLMMLAALLITWWLERSKTGHYWIAIREDEEAAEAAGVNMFAYKTLALVISAFLAAIGGTFFAQYRLATEPGLSFSLVLLVDILLGTMLGGTGTVMGPVIGAFAFVGLHELTSLIPIASQKAAALSMILYGVILISVVMFLPNGLISIGKRLGGFFRTKPASKSYASG